MEDRDAAILRIMSLGCATEPPWYKGATIIVIGKRISTSTTLPATSTTSTSIST